MGGLVLSAIIILEIISIKLTLNQCKTRTVIKASVGSTIIPVCLIWWLISCWEIEPIFVDSNLSSTKILFLNLLIGLLIFLIKFFVEYLIIKRDLGHKKYVIEMLLCICGMMTLLGAFAERVWSLLIA